MGRGNVAAVVYEWRAKGWAFRHENLRVPGIGSYTYATSSKYISTLARTEPVLSQIPFVLIYPDNETSGVLNVDADGACRALWKLCFGLAPRFWLCLLWEGTARSNLGRVLCVVGGSRALMSCQWIIFTIPTKSNSSNSSKRFLTLDGDHYIVPFVRHRLNFRTFVGTYSYRYFV